MRIDKVILKAVLSTLMAIIVLCGVMLAALVFIYPSTMMNLTYGVGLDEASAWFADRAYKQNDRVYFIAYATEVAIGADDAEGIEKYGGAFIADKGFGEYCAEMDRNTPGEYISGNYAQYIYGQICVAKYRLDKKTEAVELAFSVNQTSFPENNAVVAVTLAAVQNGGDQDVLGNVLDKMQALKAQQNETRTFSDEDFAYLNQWINLTQSRMDKLP